MRRRKFGAGERPHHMFERNEGQRLDILAADLANAYVKFLEEFPNSNAVSIANFGDFYAEQRLEYLLYAGSTHVSKHSTPLSTPYHEVIVSDLLQLSAAYLSVPSEMVRPHTRLFGLLLCYYYFATQPQQGVDSCLAPTRISVAVSVLEDLLVRCDPHSDHHSQPPAAVAGTEDGNRASPAAKVALPSSLIALGLTLDSPGRRGGTSTAAPSSSSAAATHLAFEDTRGSASSTAAPTLSAVEKTALLSLHKYNAFHVQPYERNEPHLSAVVKAHDAIGPAASLLPPSVLSARRPSTATGAGTPLTDDPAFKERLAEYQAMMAEVGS